MAPRGVDHKKAKLFEYLVAVFAHRNGLRAGVPLRHLQGRGTKHQIDVVAIDPLPAPFVFPTRLLCEAKCYTDSGRNTLGVEVVRNLYAEVTDLQQTLPRQRKLILDPVWEEPVSCVYSGAVFSTIPFSRRAQEFANSYAISLVPLPTALADEHMGRLQDKLKHFDNHPNIPPGPGGVTGCPRRCFDQLPFARDVISSVLAIASNDPMKLKSGEQRRVFVYALDALIANCPYLMGLNQILRRQRLASIGSSVVTAYVSEDDFTSLARRLSQRFLDRSGDGVGNLARTGMPPNVEIGHHGFAPIAGAELGPGGPEELGPAPRGFEWFSLYVLNTRLSILASKGTRDSIRTAHRPCAFTMPLDFGLVLHVDI